MWRPLGVFGRASWLVVVVGVLPSSGAVAKRVSVKATATTTTSATGATGATRKVATARPAAMTAAAMTAPEAAAPRAESPSFREASFDLDAVTSFGPAPAQILSPPEAVSLARKHAMDLSVTLIEGERIREAAAREQDLIRLSCVQDHLLRMKLVKRVADDSLAVLGRPEIFADELRLRHEFRSVEMGLEQLLRLREEMLECAGADMQGGEATNPEVGAKPADVIDPTSLPIDHPQPERPLSASPAI